MQPFYGELMTRFLKFIPSEEAFWLMHNKPNAFRLLTHIANTARRKNGNPDGLTQGQCHLQHWTFYGLTQQEYRTAKKILVERKHVKILETNRTRKKSTTGTTTASTLVELCSLTVWDIIVEEYNDRINDRATTDQRLTNDKQEEDISNDISKKEDAERDGAHPAPPIRSKDSLIFNFENYQFEGITEKDRADWAQIYPHINSQVEILKAAQWVKSNPSKGNKKQWRKFLTGWFQRANDTIENKKAFKTAGAASGIDRRTKDIYGVPVEAPHLERLF
jgi:hypothetical protein